MTKSKALLLILLSFLPLVYLVTVLKLTTTVDGRISAPRNFEEFLRLACLGALTYTINFAFLGYNIRHLIKRKDIRPAIITMWALLFLTIGTIVFPVFSVIYFWKHRIPPPVEPVLSMRERTLQVLSILGVAGVLVLIVQFFWQRSENMHRVDATAQYLEVVGRIAKTKLIEHGSEKFLLRNETISYEPPYSYRWVYDRMDPFNDTKVLEPDYIVLELEFVGVLETRTVRIKELTGYGSAAYWVEAQKALPEFQFTVVP